MHEFVTQQNSTRPSRKAATLGLLAASAILVSLSLTQVACVKDNPTFAVDAPIDGPPTGCVADPGKCTVGTLVCEPVEDVCVECLPGSAAACVGMEPVCSDTNMCRGCTEHSECASAVCLPDGSCAAEAEVAYVNGGNGMGTTCTKTAPCKTVTVAVAVATPKVIVKVTGAVVEPAKIVITSARRLFGESKATVRASGGMKTIFEIPTGGNLAVHQLDVGGTVNLKPDRCYQIPSSETGQLTLVGGKVSNCVIGVESLSNGGTVTVTGATVSGNTGGGLSITGSSFKLVNNVIANNGNVAIGGSDFGGVFLSGTGAASELTQNTIVGNLQQASALGAGGVTCTIAAFAGERNIIAGNTPSSLAMQVTGGTYPNSFLAASFASLMFANVATLNFHLTAASPATVRDVAGLTTCPGNDIDGEARPFNALCDLGADEYKP